MKTSYLFLLFLFALSCTEASIPENESAETSRSESSSTPDAKSDGGSRSGNYASLFNSPDCKVATVEEISAATGLSFMDMNIQGTCSYESKIGDRTWYISIIKNEMSSEEIQKEIEIFKSDETGMLSYQMSETGDTYLCIQHSTGYLSMYNPDYSSSILIRYGSVGESRKFSKEERIEHQAKAVKLANALLTKHKQ